MKHDSSILNTAATTAALSLLAFSPSLALAREQGATNDPICCVKRSQAVEVDTGKFFAALSSHRLEVLKDGTNDKNHPARVTLSDLIKEAGEKPIIVLSMGSVCPHAIKAQRLYNELFNSVKDEARVVMVFNGTVQQAREFKNNTGLKCLVVCDPTCTVTYEGSPIERSSTSMIFQGGRPARTPSEVANTDLTTLTIPCSEKGFQFLVQGSFGTKTNEASAAWTKVNQKIGESLKRLSFQYGCPSAPL